MYSLPTLSGFGGVVGATLRDYLFTEKDVPGAQGCQKQRSQKAALFLDFRANLFYLLWRLLIYFLFEPKNVFS